jgi:hypothetical protein
VWSSCLYAKTSCRYSPKGKTGSTITGHSCCPSHVKGLAFKRCIRSLPPVAACLRQVKRARIASCATCQGGCFSGHDLCFTVWFSGPLCLFGAFTITARRCCGGPVNNNKEWKRGYQQDCIGPKVGELGFAPGHQRPLDQTHTTHYHIDQAKEYSVIPKAKQFCWGIMEKHTWETKMRGYV